MPALEESTKSPSRPKAPLPLPQKTERHLSAYALAASAAGVSVLALTRPAEGKVVYTPTHRVMSTSDPQHWWFLDLNRDGVKDFSFSAYVETGMSSQFAFLRCVGLASNRVLGTGAYDAALYPGVRIGPKGGFGAPDHSMARVSTFQGSPGFQAPWANHGKGVKDRYLGLKFAINGKIHYGWGGSK